jgi:hypothetical protein
MLIIFSRWTRKREKEGKRRKGRIPAPFLNDTRAVPWCTFLCVGKMKPFDSCVERRSKGKATKGSWSRTCRNSFVANEPKPPHRLAA